MLQRDFNEALESVFENGRKYLKFQDFVIPSLKLSRIFGFIPFEIDDEGKIRVNYVKPSRSKVISFIFS